MSSFTEILIASPLKDGDQWVVRKEFDYFHDYLYSTHERSRKEADDIFYEAMLVLGTPKWKAGAMYRAVRMFGGGSYKKHSSYTIPIKDTTIEIPELAEDVCLANYL